MNLLKPGYAFLLLCLLPGACSSEEDNAEQKALDEAMEKWESAGLDDYHFTFGALCECVFSESAIVTVTGGEISEVFDPDVPVAEQDLDTWYTVPELFALAQEAIDGDPDSLQLEYDGTLGYPTVIRIDWDTQIVDEEVDFSVSDLAADPK